MKTRSFEEKVKLARKTKFSLPPEVTYEKTFLPDGIWAYVFRHNKLGELGRLLILPHSSDQTQFSCEVVGDPDDPMTKKRQAILEPITKGMLSKMEEICGVSEGKGQVKPYNLSKERYVVQSKVMPCDKCGVTTAMLIIAPDAFTVDQLEDYARTMFPKIKELNVPTWIVGAEREVNINGDLAGEALILKVWPEREQAKVIPSTEFNPIIDELMQNHCRK